MTTIETRRSLSELHVELQARIAEGAGRLNVPGVAVGIHLRGEEDYVFHGVTSIENPLAVDETTYFQIGSTSKTYTATVLAILADRGLVDLSVPVRTYVPELELSDEAAARAVTVEHLLSHTAGWVGDILEETGDGDDALEKYVARLAGVEQLEPPGKVASYNNAAFSLAGRVIEKVTGQPFESAVRELLLDPAALDESLYFTADVMTRRFAVGHKEKDGVLRVARPWPIPRSVAPAGGIASTAADQLRYARFHLGDGTGKDGVRLMSEGWLRRMQTPVAPLGGGALGDFVGLSWLLRDVDGARIVGHGGATNGQMAAFEMVPDRDFAIAVLTNADKGSALHHELVKWAREAYLGIADPEDVPLDLSTQELAAYAGRFDTRTSIVDVSVEGDRLVLRSSLTDEGRRQHRALLGDEPDEPEPIIVKPLLGDGLVVVEGDAKGMKFTVLRNDDGRVIALNLSRIARRIDLDDR